MLSNGLWPPVYGNSCSTWVILSFPHFAEWTSMLTYVLRSIWCCREINKKNTCILPCQFRVNTHLPIVIIRFPWLHFIFKPSIVKSKKNRKSSKDRLFWHYDGKNATYVDNFVFGLLMSHGSEKKNTGIVVFNKNLKWNDHCVLSWWVIWTYCYTPPEIITCYKCIAFQSVVRRSLCLVVL